MIQQEARVIVAIAAEADDEFIWSQLKMLPELFAMVRHGPSTRPGSMVISSHRSCAAWDSPRPPLRSGLGA